VAEAHSCSNCLGSGIGSHDKRLSDRALVALGLIQYARADIFEESAQDYLQCAQLMQHASAFDPPPAFLAAAAPVSSLSQYFRDRALSLLLASTLSGADDGCAWLILASAAVGGGSLAVALEHLQQAHSLDGTEACALSNRSIVLQVREFQSKPKPITDRSTPLLQLKGDHAAAFEAVKQAITLRCV
jgi:hypothetical protein